VVGAVSAAEAFGWLRDGRVRAGTEPKPQAQAAAPDARDADRGAIRAAMDSFVKAFESRDAKALAGHWTDQGEYQTVEGARVKGRDALEKGFIAFFGRTPEVTARVDSEALRFLSGDSAIDEGKVSVRRGPTEPMTKARYSALFVRDNGRWQLAQLSESSDDKASIEDLGWLIGQWKAASKGAADIETVYSWLPSKKFIQAQFTVKEKDHTFSGSQIIGVDPNSGLIHSWTFEADGGVAEADWRPDGDHWVLDATGTGSDGGTQKATNILRRVNNDTITWQSIDRTVADSQLPDLAPVKVTRVKN
jgi:uncharacterized protein (TIGR02246 family)